MTNFAGTFDRHEIRDRVTAPHFGSWRLMRRTESGGWTGVFWCRITAADGLLRVSGDFDPIVFQGHLSHEDDPIERVAWMGSRETVGHYVRQKASMGTGEGGAYSWDTEDACEDLRELIADREKELAEEHEAEDDIDEDEVTRLRRDIEAFKCGVETCVDYSGEPGCVEIMQAVFDYEPDPVVVDSVTATSVRVRQYHEIESEVICEIGRRPSNALELAHLAVRRLHELLQAEARAVEATAKISEAALDLGEAVVGTSEAFETLRARLGELTETYDVPEDASWLVIEDGVSKHVPCVLPGDDATKMTAAKVAANMQQHPRHGWRFGYSEGAITFDTSPDPPCKGTLVLEDASDELSTSLGLDAPQTTVVERLRAEQREYAIEQELDPDLCPCGNPGVCVGEYEGDVYPKLGCAECCNHEDFGECGRCWPLVREAGT